MYKNRQTQCHKEQRFPYVSYNAFKHLEHLNS